MAKPPTNNQKPTTVTLRVRPSYFGPLNLLMRSLKEIRMPQSMFCSFLLELPHLTSSPSLVHRPRITTLSLLRRSKIPVSLEIYLPHLLVWLPVAHGLKYYHCIQQSTPPLPELYEAIPPPLLPYSATATCASALPCKMLVQLFFAAVALLGPYLYRTIRFKRLKQFARFPQLPPSAVLGHLGTVDEFVKRSAPGAHPGS